MLVLSIFFVFVISNVLVRIVLHSLEMLCACPSVVWSENYDFQIVEFFCFLSDLQMPGASKRKCSSETIEKVDELEYGDFFETLIV